MNRDLLLRIGSYLAKHPFRTFAAMAVMTLALVYCLHRQSYCISEGRFVSDREMINAAIRDELWDIVRPNTPNTYVNLPDQGEQILPFEGVDAFEEKNPGCCKILHGAEERSALSLYGILDGVFGYYAVVVGLRYNLRYLDKQGVEQQRATHSIIPVSSCGKIELEALRGG